MTGWVGGVGGGGRVCSWGVGVGRVIGANFRDYAPHLSSSRATENLCSFLLVLNRRDLVAIEVIMYV